MSGDKIRNILNKALRKCSIHAGKGTRFRDMPLRDKWPILIWNTLSLSYWQGRIIFWKIRRLEKKLGLRNGG